MYCYNAAACERESVAMQEFDMATSELEKTEAKSLVQKAVMQQQELAVQEMQQSVMQQQQELASEVMQQHKQDAAVGLALVTLFCSRNVSSTISTACV